MKMKIRDYIKCKVFFSFLKLGMCFCSKPPHIIFILVDDLGWNDVSFHGSLQIPTPNIDTLAFSGIILNNYYVQPLCTPSRGALMTGKYPIKLGLQHSVIGPGEPWGLPLNETLLPQHLKKLGYATHCVGKWHLGYFKKDYLPNHRGFDSFFGLYDGKADYFTHLDNSTNKSGLDFHDNDKLARNYSGQYATEVFTDKAKEIISSHNSSKPLFLFISHQAVHTGNHGDPLQAPKKYVEKFSYIKDKNRRKFAGMVDALDKSVGEVFSALHKKGMLENSIIAFSTDNGAAVEGIDLSMGSNWPLRGSKYNLWEGGIRGNAFIWSQLLLNSTKTVYENLMHITDWLPTLYAAAGGDVKKLGKIDGYNFWPSFSENSSAPRNHILLNIDKVWKMEGIRKKKYKLLKGTIYKDKFSGWFSREGKKKEGSAFAKKELKEMTKNYKKELYKSDVYKLLSKKCENGLQLLYKSSKEIRKSCRASSINKFEECLDIVKTHEETHYMHAINKPIVIECGRKPKNASDNCKPNQDYCLFDIEKDPCEYNNLANDLPSVKKELKKLLDEYRKDAVPPRIKPQDPKSDPKYHGYAWVPWVKDKSNKTL